MHVGAALKRASKIVAVAACLPLAAVLVAGAGPAFSSCGRSGDYAIDRLRANPRARDLLGEDIHRSTFGWACGTVKIEGGLERSSWTVPVEGSRARGRYEYAVDMVGGDVTFSGRLRAADADVAIH